MADRTSLQTELAAFIGEYERANNIRDISRVVPFIAEDAVYWFSDGSHRGIEEIRSAIEKTFAGILDEVYEVRELEWPVLTADVAVCRYLFAWTGVVNGELRSGQGRGTNVIVRRDGKLKMLHEHLSS
ncbi:YybH family protein [Streptomyces sp. NPDC086033]|uniref:YybH family protein n=1 Tax=Streptomyces sp. NPDC086033 TaxID=3365747 RepID=UPI0037D81FB7